MSAEQLPAGTGEPNQLATLVHTPVLPETLRLSVGGELWQPIDDLTAAAAEVAVASSPATAAAAKVYTLDPASGEIRFGDGAHGARPPAGAALVAAYAYGGGRDGVVGIGAINRGTGLPAGIEGDQSRAHLGRRRGRDAWPTPRCASPTAPPPRPAGGRGGLPGDHLLHPRRRPGPRRDPPAVPPEMPERLRPAW